MFIKNILRGYVINSLFWNLSIIYTAYFSLYYESHILTMGFPKNAWDAVCLKCWPQGRTLLFRFIGMAQGGVFCCKEGDQRFRNFWNFPRATADTNVFLGFAQTRSFCSTFWVVTLWCVMCIVERMYVA